MKTQLSDLGDEDGAWLADRTIEEVQKTKASEDPEELFGEEAEKSRFLEEKIHFTGTRLLCFERQVTKRLNLPLISVAIAVGVALLVLVTGW